MKKIIIVILCTVLLVSCSTVGSGSTDLRIVLKIDGHDVTYDDYMYFYLNTIADLSGTDYRHQELLEKVESTLMRHYAVYNLAERYGIEYDSDMKQAVDNEVEYTIEFYGSEEEYYNQLSINNMTGDCYRKILEISQIEIAVRDYLMNEYTSDIMADDAAVEKDFNANFVRATHILILHDNGNTDEENKKLAEELRDRITNGEDFDTLLWEYGEDTGLDYEDGYYMTHGLYNETFENTAYSLDIGEISNVVESVIGFHIVKRLPLDIEYLYDNYEEVRYIYKTRVINERLDDIAATLTVEYTDIYNNEIVQQ